MQIMTVLGPIEPGLLGFTNAHEHLLSDLYHESRSLDGVMNDEDLIVEELAILKAAGGSALVEVTNRGLGRQPEALRRIALATGLHIVMGCGWYRQKFYDETIDRTRTDDLAADMVQDLTRGADGTGIRAGVIGEIGSDKGYITAAEERVLRAAARASRETNAAITTHAVCHPLGIEQLDILEQEGVKPTRVIIGHCDSYLRLDYHEAIARRGAYVEYDTFGKRQIYSDERRIAMLAELLRRGYETRILLSTDVCLRSNLHAYGGPGYDHLISRVVPALRVAGISEQQIHLMTVTNPARVLAF